MLSLDEKIQLNYCTNPIRQQKHQKLQIGMLENSLDTSKWKITHPKEGLLNIDGQNIVDISRHSRSLSRNARSIDIVIESIFSKEKLVRQFVMTRASPV